MTVLLAARPAGHTAVKKQLGSGIPPRALAADVHILCGVKIFCWVTKESSMQQCFLAARPVGHTVK